VLGVEPREEDVAVSPRVLDRAEPLGERRPILERLELRLRERVVVGVEHMTILRMRFAWLPAWQSAQAMSPSCTCLALTLRTLDDPRRRKVEPAEETVGGLLMAYLLERKLPSKSEAEFRAAYKRFTRIVGEHTPAKDVTKAQCREFKAALLASKLALGSVKKLLGIVATIWNHAVSQGLVDSSPFTGLTKVSRQTDQTEGASRTQSSRFGRC
jgi:hypothetical protein